MDPKNAIMKIEEELVETCGAVGKLIVNNAARNAGFEKTHIASKTEFLAVLEFIEEPAAKFLGKIKAEECITRWKGLV